MKSIFSKLLPIVAISVLVSGCGPVNILTRVKKVPRQYSVNYNHPNVKAKKSELNKKAWVVYSDREGNVTAHVAGGALPHTELKFMEPMLVIGKSGDYYKLIKHDPAILKNERLSKHKDAEFYGWIHKDRLLLFDNAITEVRNGVKLKSLTSITESRIVADIEKYVEKDSIILYSEPTLEERLGKSLGFNSLVYVLKMTNEDSRALVAYKNTLTPDDATSITIGWVDAALVAPLGQKLILSIPPYILNDKAYSSDSVRQVNSPVEFSPMLYTDRMEQGFRFRTLDAQEIIDRSDNKVYNVLGEPISYQESQEIAAQLKNINVIFSFDMTKNVAQQMPMLSNTVQNIKTLFEEKGSTVSYHFAAVIGHEVIPFTKSYAAFSDLLIDVGKQVAENSVYNGRSSLTRAVELAEQMPKATNIVIYVGEVANFEEAPPKYIVNGFIANNCRLLSYQVYADDDNSYNNFVLQSAAIVESYAAAISKSKRSIIVYSDQLRADNQFKENTKNSYTLDFPKRSMTQGAVVFPEKQQLSGPENLIAAIDTLVRQVREDNFELIASLDRAFRQVGNHRNKFDSYFAAKNGLEANQRTTPELNNAFMEVSPQWVSVTDRIAMPIDSANLTNTSLFISETELEQLKQLMEQLSSMELEQKGEVSSTDTKLKSIQKVRKKMRNVPADSQLGVVLSAAAADTLIEREYVKTKKVRKHLQKTYTKELKGCIFNGKPKKLTLAQAQEYITAAPTVSQQLSSLRIKDLAKKKMLSDEELADLLELFVEHKKLIEEKAVAADKLNSPEGEKFYYLPCSALP